MIEIKQTATFLKWTEKLKDKKTKALISARIFRLSNGLFGDIKALGDGLNELRIHYGPGYRVYFKKENNQIIILLCGGDKSSQKKDIEMARRMLREGSI